MATQLATPAHLFAARNTYAGERAEHGRRLYQARVLTELLIAWFGAEQRRPTARERRADALDHFAARPWILRHWSVRARLEHLGLTVEQVESWATVQSGWGGHHEHD